jgi:AmiR/NasT family two-component response regulator
LKETSATGYVLFQKTAAAPGLARVAAIGEEIQASILLAESNAGVIVLPLHTNGVTDGFIAFSFADRQTLSKAEPSVRSIVDAMQTIWSARHPDAQYLNLARRLSALESQLIDSKIVDRAQGLLTGDHAADALDSLVSHVHNVFRPSSAAHTLQTILEELEDEIEERRVTGQAKAILQAAYSLSEEQAYTHLQTLSRKSRRRLKEVAADVMAKHTLKAQTA